jgi:hypothetical protein
MGCLHLVSSFSIKVGRMLQNEGKEQLCLFLEQGDMMEIHVTFFGLFYCNLIIKEYLQFKVCFSCYYLI